MRIESGQMVKWSNGGPRHDMWSGAVLEHASRTVGRRWKELKVDFFGRECGVEDSIEPRLWGRFKLLGAAERLQSDSRKSPASSTGCFRSRAAGGLGISISSVAC